VLKYAGTNRSVERLPAKKKHMKRRKSQVHTIEQWREDITPEEKKKLYLESIPEQVSQSMTFEGEPVNIKKLKKYLKTLKNISQPYGP
jgi:hypothetical protein